MYERVCVYVDMYVCTNVFALICVYLLMHLFMVECMHINAHVRTYGRKNFIVTILYGIGMLCANFY